VRCLTARRYAGPDDDVVLRVEDPFGPTGSRTWQVAVRDGSAEVQPTDRSADATLDIGTDDGHSIGQEGVILGTSRVLQTIFRHRARPGRTGPLLLH
jgi:hypothetical protein